MPPRLQLAWRIKASCFALQLRPVPPISVLAGPVSKAGQARQAHILGSLSDPGTAKFRRRVGRGPSSGRGKTAGRGQKGQWAHGKVNSWFQGGQTPLIVSLGRKGKDNVRAPVMSIANLDQVQEWIDLGRLDASKPITPKELIQCGIIGKVRDGVKLLARGKEKLKVPLDIMVSRASGEAIEAVEKAGGKIVTRYYTKQAIKWLLAGKAENTDKPLPYGSEHVEAVVSKARVKGYMNRLPDPTSRPDMEYYRDPAHRGYLSHLIKPGENPSLLYGVPSERRRTKHIKKAGKAGKSRGPARVGGKDQILWTL